MVNVARFHELIYEQRFGAVQQNVPVPSLVKGTEIAVNPPVVGAGVVTTAVAVLVTAVVAVLVAVLTTAVAVLVGAVVTVVPPVIVIVPPWPDGVPMLL
jgi:hypothetical protein